MRLCTFLLLLGLLAAAPAAGQAPAHVAVLDEAPYLVDAGPPRRHARERLLDIQRRIQAALQYPPLARSRALEGTTRLRFDIEHDGSVRDVVVHASSGRPSLDRAALAAVDAAAPLPWVYGRLEVPVVFALERRR